MPSTNPHNMTDKQYAFCQLYLSEFPRNQERAYRIVYPGLKNSNTAKAAAARMMKNPKVEAYINEQNAKLKEKLEERYLASTESVLKEEGYLAHSSIKSLFNPDGTAIKPHELPEEVARMIKRFKPVKIYMGKDAHGLDIYIEGWEYEFWDKGQSLNRLEKVFGMQVDHVKHGVDEDLRSLLEEIDGRHRGLLPGEIEDD